MVRTGSCDEVFFFCGEDKLLGFVATVEFFDWLITAAQEKHCTLDVFEKRKAGFNCYLCLHYISGYNCTDEDYKFWSPSAGNGSYMPCVLGRKETYQRRIPHSNCFNGRNYDRPIKMEICECGVEDYDW